MITLDQRLTDEGTLLVTANGRLDLISALEFKTLVASKVAAGQVVFVVDLTEVSFMDSSGLGALISGYRAASQAGGSFRIGGALPQVRSVLELTRVDQILRPYATVDEALADG